MENKGEISRTAVLLAAIDPYLEQHIILPTESKVRGKDMIEWGQRNSYPNYLLELSMTVPSLRSVITSTTDYIVGNNQNILPLPGTNYAPNVMNIKGDTIRSQVEAIARDFETYGGFALEVIRGLDGSIVEVYYCDIRFLRSNKDNTVFYYCEKWNEGRTKDAIVRPAYQEIKPERWALMTPDEQARVASSIVFIKNTNTQTYPYPVYGAAVKDCEVERSIADYHLNAIKNGFMGSVMVNFNNGQPSDRMKEEVEKDLNEKFSGHQNAQRIIVNWNEDKEHAATIVPIKVEDFGARYDALSKHCRQQIFTSFRCNPNLVGIPTENLGFSEEEYNSAFKLYNRTCVMPVQRIIREAYDKIYGQTGVLTIVPFSMEGEEPNAN